MGRILMMIFLLGMLSCKEKTPEKKIPKPMQSGLTTSRFKTYGEELSKTMSTKPDELKAILNTQDSAGVKLEGTIMEVCQKKGCWMKVDLGNGEIVRVTFKDYGFFVPKDVAGNFVVMEGQGFKKSTSVEQLKHFAEDGGSSEEEIAKIIEPKEEISFVASAVGIIRF